MLPGAGGEDVVVRWVIDPTQAEQGAQRATQAVEQGAARQQRAAAGTDAAVERNARSYQQYANTAARISRGVSAGIGAATAAVMAQERSWLAVASVVLTSFAAGGPVVGAITAVGAGVGFLVGQLKKVPKEIEEIERRAKALHEIEKSVGDARRTLAAYKALGREPTGPETELLQTRKLIENLQGALSTSRNALIKEMFSENTTAKRLNLLRQVVAAQERDLAALEKQEGEYRKLISAEAELVRLREKSAKALAESEAAIERTIAKGPRRTTTDHESSRAAKFLSESRSIVELEDRIAQARGRIASQNLMGTSLSDTEAAIRAYEGALGKAREAALDRERAAVAERLEYFRQFGNEAGTVMEGSLIAAITDGIFEGFKNARKIVEGFARDFLQITLRAAYEASIGESVTSFFRNLFGAAAGAAGGAGTGGYGGYANAATYSGSPGGFSIFQQASPFVAVVPSRTIAGGIETDQDLQSQLAGLGKSTQTLDDYRRARY